jgi:hypothetical protein
VDAYQRDLLQFAIWLVGILGSLGLATVIWGIKAGLARMDNQDTQLEEIRKLLQSELTLLREDHHALDVRVTRIEERCDVVMAMPNHSKGSD